MGKTDIEYGDTIWPLTAGCTKKDRGCKHCWAEGMTGRLAAMATRDLQQGRNPGDKHIYRSVVKSKPGTGLDGFGPKSGWNGKVIPIPSNLEAPYHWKRRRVVLVNFMSDLFHEGVETDFIQMALQVMYDRREHTYVLLTKRPERMAEELHRWAFGCGHGVANHILCGFSAHDQTSFNARWAQASKAAAEGWRVWASLEPLLGPVDASAALRKSGPRLSWMVVGGESGPDAEPLHPAWPCALRDQCVGVGVPYDFKQWGECIPRGQIADCVDGQGWVIRPGWKEIITGKKWGCLDHSGLYREETTTWNGREGCASDDYEVTVYRVGKKAAGDLLDGKRWKQLPEVAR
jgi:protein gp37